MVEVPSSFLNLINIVYEQELNRDTRSCLPQVDKLHTQWRLHN